MLQDSADESGVLGEQNQAKPGARPKELPSAARQWLAGHRVFVLALENTENEQERQKNEALLSELKKYFFITEKEDYKLGEDPTQKLKEMGYTNGMKGPQQKKEELMIVFSIDKKVNDLEALMEGTAEEFLSGYKPNLMQDFSRIKYLEHGRQERE